MTTSSIDSKDWTPEEEQLLKELRPNMMLGDVYRRFRDAGFQRSRKALERKATNLGVFFQGTPRPQQPAVVNTAYSSAWDKIVRIKEQYKQDYEHRQVGILPPETITRKILCISDLHIPFDRDDLVYKIIQDHKDADILVVNGDLLDLYAVSTWPKERSIILRKEYDIAMEYMKVFSRTFKNVVFTRGNHEYRLNRYFHSNISPSVSFMVSKEILSRLVRGEVYDEEGNVVTQHAFNNIHYDSGPEAWFVKIGKAMFIHPTSFSRVEGKTVISGQEYFMERTDIQAVVLSHTHQQVQIPSRNKMCIETGCLCCPMDYEKQGKLQYKAMTLGYTVIYQDAEGNVDFNRSHNVYLGTQYPVKKSYDEMLEEANRNRETEEK